VNLITFYSVFYFLHFDTLSGGRRRVVFLVLDRMSEFAMYSLSHILTPYIGGFSQSHVLTIYVGRVRRVTALMIDRMSEFALFFTTFCPVFYTSHSDILHRKAFSISQSNNLRRKGTTCRCSYRAVVG